MEILYFVLGASIALLVLVVIDVFTIKNKLEKLEEEFQFHERGTHDVTVDLHRRIDDVNDTTYQKIDYEVRELQSRIDSQSKKKK